MNAAAPHAAQPFAARVVDAERRGSVWSQALVGGVGIVLAVVLVLGQISLATTKGMQKNLAANVEQIKDGNATMAKIIEKSKLTPKMDTLIASQAATLERTGETMSVLNGQMKTVGATTDGLTATVEGMETTSSSLTGSVQAMDAETARMVELLGGMPGATDRTHRQLLAIGGDTSDINAELAAIAAKMQRYGLPPAKGVQKR